ncbi:hypothetical protein [Gottfriedia solisilvae]|uniref:hypothetical protein n=1 Tax=Gottfriedia solisilvae TaxID=1516104 RepID=UPI003D2EF879
MDIHLLSKVADSHLKYKQYEFTTKENIFVEKAEAFFNHFRAYVSIYSPHIIVCVAKHGDFSKLEDVTNLFNTEELRKEIFKQEKEKGHLVPNQNFEFLIFLNNYAHLKHIEEQTLEKMKRSITS